MIKDKDWIRRSKPSFSRGDWFPLTHGAPHADLIPPDTSPASAAVSASSRQGHRTRRAASGPALMRSVWDVRCPFHPC